VGRGYRKFNKVSFPEEKEGNVKEANRKLRAEIRSLKKIIKILESENRTLSRSFNKSCDYIQEVVKDKNLEDVMDMISDFDYKETEKGREKEKGKNSSQKEDKTCPKCNNAKYKVMNFGSFKIHTCTCGYREKVIIANEGIERS